MSINIFGQRLKEARTRMDWSLRRLAEECGTSASFLSDLELGKKMPSMAKASDIAKALNVPMTWLMGEDELKENEDVLSEYLEKDGVMYQIFLSKHIFPNGLTYEQMFDKIKLLEKLENLMSSSNTNKGDALDAGEKGNSTTD